MSYHQYHDQTTVHSGTAVDAGLQDFMRSVYNTMAMGLVVTGLVAFAVAKTPALASIFIFSPLRIVAILAPLGFIFFGFTSARIARLPADKVRSMFYLFSALMGLSFATIFMAYSGASIARASFVTAGAFSATSLYGYVTKKDLSSMGSFLFMGLIGLILAMVVNIFLQSSAMHFIISCVGVLIFTGLTAYDTQRLKYTYSSSLAMAEANAKLGIMGALSLYLNFINLFQFILSFMGSQD